MKCEVTSVHSTISLPTEPGRRSFIGPKTVIELAGWPNERRLFAQILAVLGAPQNPRATIVELERTTVRLLGDLGVQVLVLDEIHNVFVPSWREQHVVFKTLRYLSNELKPSLVCFGNM